jgi:hypothetical protein
MKGRTRPPEPEHHLGVYQSIADVPANKRLHAPAFETVYRERDLWSEWFETRQNVGKRAQQNIERTGRRWSAYLNSDDIDTDATHHALASPADVNGWFEWLMDGGTDGGLSRSMGPMTCYRAYATYLIEFYNTLMWSTKHELHTYNPAIMAAAGPYPEFEAARRVWNARIEHSNSHHEPLKIDRTVGGSDASQAQAATAESEQ